MKNLLQEINPEKPMPCLFYPLIREAGLSVAEVLTNAEKQAALLRDAADAYPVGAVIRMTELWCEAASFGMDCRIREDDFPLLGEPLCEEAEELAELEVPDVINPVTKPLIEAVRLAAPGRKKPLFVGVTGPYTMGAVLNGSENFMMNGMTEPEDIHIFLRKATDFLLGYIRAYKEAGADGVLIAEPSAAMVSPDMLREFSNAYLREIIETVQDDTFAVLYHNCGAVNPHMEAIAELPAAAFHFGSDVDLLRARALLPADRHLLGNLDPRLFLGGKASAVQTVQEKTARMKQTGAQMERYIASTGCDLSPAARAETIEAFLTSGNG